MQKVDPLVLRALIQCDMEANIKLLQNVYDMVCWDSVDICALADVSASLDQLAIMFDRIRFDENTKLKLE